MGRTKLSIGKLDWSSLLEMAAVGMLLAGGFPVRSLGQQGQKKFSSPENAINALVTAAQNNDEEAILDPRTRRKANRLVW
jgi:hypothetical protein